MFFLFSLFIVALIMNAELWEYDIGERNGRIIHGCVEGAYFIVGVSCVAKYFLLSCSVHTFHLAVNKYNLCFFMY